MASSWGKSEDKDSEASDGKSRGEIGRDKDLKSEIEKWQEELNTYLDKFRRRVEKHPYETLFGASIRRGVWNPWENHWNHWMRNLAKDEWISSNVTGQNQAKSQESKLDGSPSQTPPVKKSYQADQSNKATRPTEAKTNDNIEIDLITLRKVQRKSPVPPDVDGGLNPQSKFEIPVKVFAPTAAMRQSSTAVSSPSGESFVSTKSKSPKVMENVKSESSVDSEKKTSTTQKGWLAKEGFSEIQEKESGSESSNGRRDTNLPASSNQEIPRIESSLDRHLRKLDPSNLDDKAPQMTLKYEAKENKAEDIDLLRVSNVRASSGHLKKPVPEPVETREMRRSILKARFEEKQKALEIQYQEEVANLDSGEIKTPSHKFLKDSSSGGQHLSPQVQMSPSAEMDAALNKLTSEPEVTANIDAWGYDLKPKGLETTYQDELDNIVQSLENFSVRLHQESMDAESQKKQKILAATNAVLGEEIEKQKAAMAAMENRGSDDLQASQTMTCLGVGEGDISESVHQFVGRDRWYKNKAPHALEESKQKAKDITLVREIRQIYEDRYGVIDTKHIQPRSSPSMEGKEDSAVQEGLREYDEKRKREDEKLPTQGKIAASDLDSFEASRLGGLHMETPGLQSGPDESTSPEPSTVEDTKMKSEIGTNLKSEAKVISESHTYKVLAFDQTTQNVAIATTTTSMYESSLPPRSVPAILSHLEQPARYFDHFEPLEAAGYELVSGSRNTLVFKKVRKENPAQTKDMQDTINKFLQSDLSTSSTLSHELTPLKLGYKATKESNTDKTKEHMPPSEIEHNEPAVNCRVLSRVSCLKTPIDSSTKANFIDNIPERPEKKAKQQTGIAAELASSSAGEIACEPQVSANENANVKKPNTDVVINNRWKGSGEQPVDDNAQRTGIDAMISSKTDNIVCPKLDSSVNPIDGTTAASPYKTPHSNPNQDLNASDSSQVPRKIVRREEEVFSGRNLSRDQYREQRRQHRLVLRAEKQKRGKEKLRRTRGRIGRTAKRILFTGTWVAACCYLVGALWEEVYRPRERKRVRADE